VGINYNSRAPLFLLTAGDLKEAFSIVVFDEQQTTSNVSIHLRINFYYYIFLRNERVLGSVVVVNF